HEKLTSRRETLRGERVVIAEEGDPPKPLELRMYPGVAVTATVKAQSTGAVIPGAIVHFGWGDFKDDNFATDAKGRVSLQPLTPQRWFIEAWADGFARKSQWLNLESGADAEVEFLLRPGGNIDGVIRDPAGNAVAGVGISVRTEENLQQLTYTRTDEQGRYRLNHLPLDSRLELYLSKLDYLSETTTARADGPKQSLDLTIRPRPHGGSIAGAVVDQEGRPIAGAELTNMGRSSNEVRKATTDKEGKFKLENLYEGAHGHEVTVRAKTFAPLRVKVKPGPAEKPAEMDIALDAGHTLKGRVEDEAGKPVEGVTVYFADGSNPFSDGGRTKTDQQGLFEFDSLPPECPFSFFKPGYSRIDRRELRLDSPDVIAVKLLPSGAIHGKVLDATTNKPIRTFHVRITFSPQRQPDDPTAGLASDLTNPGQAFQSEQGLFKIGELLLGMPLQVMVDSEGYEREVLERVVAERADRLEPVEFKLTPIDPASLTTYSGRLHDAQGKPVAGAVLRLIAGTIRQPGPRNAFRNNWRMIRSGRLAQQAGIVRFVEGKTDAAGRFEFTRIPKDLEVELVWWGAGIAPGRSDHLELFEEKDRTAIEIELPAPAIIKATIDRKAFPEISQISLHSRDTGNEERQVLLKPGQKSFEIADLAPGTYTVLVMGPNERIRGQFPGAFTSKPLAQIAITLAAGETKELDFASP
ncbi:MAG TPA: carboxypeptidase-like regulatory domain-containing protein, partial [Planctomycetaceae bacterium]|nr:carboxypeptidase-like regulatory domain-containing protein [Planctomycetaceae bacterium]